MDSSCDNNVLRDDVLVKIIENIPIAQWPQLELVSKQFERCTRRTYRALTSLNLKNIFLAKFGEYSVSEDRLLQFFTKLIQYCPHLRTITGFDCFSRTLTFPHLEFLGNLPQLKNISLKDCKLNANVFSRVMKNFTLMKSLEINSCRFVNDLGTYINNDDLVDNDLYFEFFENFCRLIELTINDYYRMFSGRFLSMINAENLKVLNFSASKFPASYLSALLNRCFNLETLYLYDPLTCAYYVGLELEVLQCLPSLPKLRKFQLCVFVGGNPNYSSDDLLNVLTRCKSLRDIRLESEDIELVTDDFLRRLIIYCPLLEILVLDIGHCYSQEILSKIADLENLTMLCLQNCFDYNLLTGLCFKLEKLNKLANLWFRECTIGEDALCTLKNLKSLTYFRLTAFVLTGRVVRGWIATGFLQKLKSLELELFNIISIGEAICENIPVLKQLSILGDINDEELLLIAKNCEYLQTLNLRNCSGVSENGLIKFLTQCSSLKLLFVQPSFYDSVSRNALFLPYKYIVRFDNDADTYNLFNIIRF